MAPGFVQEAAHFDPPISHSSLVVPILCLTMKLFVLALSLVSVASFGVVPQSATRTSTQLHETFGLGVGEDTYENQPDFLKGEGEYKEWINSVNEKNMLNRKVGLAPLLLPPLILSFVSLHCVAKSCRNDDFCSTTLSDVCEN